MSVIRLLHFFFVRKKEEKKEGEKQSKNLFLVLNQEIRKHLQTIFADNFLFIFNKEKIMMKKQRSEGNENDINKK